MRTNTQALITTNTETEKSLKGSVLPVLERLHKEIKSKGKELTHGASKGHKEVEKARNSTQKHIELLGQQTAAFESTGGKLHSTDDPSRKSVIKTNPLMTYGNAAHEQWQDGRSPSGTSSPIQETIRHESNLQVELSHCPSADLVSCQES